MFVIEGRLFTRDRLVGIVKRNAAGFEEGVEGLAGGICSTLCIRLVEFMCIRAREEAVAAEYPLGCCDVLDSGAELS